MTKFKPGISFGDFVVQDFKVQKSRVVEVKSRDFRRGWLIWLIVLMGFGVLIVRLAELQVFRGVRYRVLADENRVKQIRLVAPRGQILDRNGVVLAQDQNGTRVYPMGKAAAHAVGYLGQIKEDEVGLLREQGNKYVAGGLIGRDGIEAMYEEQLRGIDGGRVVEVDSQGHEVRELGVRQPTPGSDIRLTLDAKLQQAAYEGLGDKKGGVVATNPKTGEVLAIASSPSFDPAQIGNYLTSSDLPLFDRTIGGAYPPGSTFKMITTSAALESGKVPDDFTFDDQGIITVNGYKYTNWLFTKRGITEGEIGFSRAITRSTDTFFYKVGEQTGPQIITDWARKMGLGAKTGIDLPGEVAGWVPNPSASSGKEWYLGNTYHLAIGQEDTLATPAQINEMTNVLATGGMKCGLHLFGGVKCTSVTLSQPTLQIIKTGMIGACSPDGTSFVMFDWNQAAVNKENSATYAKSAGPLPVIACKTGTAEYVAADGVTRSHGWLTAYAPADDPQISVTVVMEGGGEGSNVAAPVVRKILSKYFGVNDTYPYSAIPSGEGE